MQLLMREAYKMGQCDRRGEHLSHDHLSPDCGPSAAKEAASASTIATNATAA